MLAKAINLKLPLRRNNHVFNELTGRSVLSAMYEISRVYKRHLAIFHSIVRSIWLEVS